MAIPPAHTGLSGEMQEAGVLSITETCPLCE